MAPMLNPASTLSRLFDAPMRPGRVEWIGLRPARRAVLRPVLVILTLPVTVVTVGLFLFVINALMFWAAAGVLDGFHVNGFMAALLGSLIYSALGLVIESALGGLFTKQ